MLFLVCIATELSELSMLVCDSVVEPFKWLIFWAGIGAGENEVEGSKVGPAGLYTELFEFWKPYDYFVAEFIFCPVFWVVFGGPA